MNKQKLREIQERYRYSWILDGLDNAGVCELCDALLEDEPDEPQQQYPPAGMVIVVDGQLRMSAGNGWYYWWGGIEDDGYAPGNYSHLVNAKEWSYLPAPRPWPKRARGMCWVATSLGEYYFIIVEYSVGDKNGNGATILYVEHEEDAIQ